MQPLRKNARILTASLVGTAVEFYDFFIYGTAAALVLGPLFFPAESPAAQTLLAFMSFGLAFVARPVGAVVFGHFGDRVGRKSTLVVSLLLMGSCTLAIAFLPTYSMVGWVAPLLLCLMRFGQGFALGGEWGGAALLAVEYAPKKWRSRFVSIMQLGSPIGFFFANGMFMLLTWLVTEDEFVSWGWRIPFLASALLVGVGLWVRLKIAETPEFRAAMERAAPARLPLALLLSGHWATVLAGAAGVIATFATFYLATAFALAYMTGVEGMPRDTILAIQLFANCFYAAGIIVAGIQSDRATPATVLGWAALATIAVGFVFGPGIQTGSLAVTTITLCGTMFVLGLTNGPLGSWLSSLFPVPVRYSGVSLAFNVGGIIGGALTPVGAQLMSAAGGIAFTGLILSVAGLCTFLGVRLAGPSEPAAA